MNQRLNMPTHRNGINTTTITPTIAIATECSNERQESLAPQLNSGALTQLQGVAALTRRPALDACAAIYACVIMNGHCCSLTLELLYVMRLLLCNPRLAFTEHQNDLSTVASLFQSIEHIIYFSCSVLDRIFAIIPCMGRAFLLSLYEIDRINAVNPALHIKIGEALRALDATLPEGTTRGIPIAVEDDDVIDLPSQFKETAPINHSIERARDGLAALFEDWLSKQYLPSYNLPGEISAFYRSIDEVSLESFATVFTQLLVDRICPDISGSIDAAASFVQVHYNVFSVLSYE